MEDILAKIMKDASSSKYAVIKQSCLESQELLANQQNLMRSPPCEIRQKCLNTFYLALESKHGKLISHALNGLQRMIWDKGFQSVFESGNEENWLPAQLLKTVANLYMYSDDVQVELLKILLNMTSTHGQSLTSNSIIALISLCLHAYSNGTSAIKTAAQATVNQTLTSFCNMLQEPDAANEEETDDSDNEGYSLLDSLSEELYPILHFTCEKLKNSTGSRIKSSSPLVLQCILSILKSIKIEIYQNSHLLNFIWQELCPILISLLGSPKTDKNIVSSQKSCEGIEIGRGSGCSAAAPSCSGAEAKTIYSIAVELVRLVGSVGSLRPVLESLFHRMLLYPSVQYRLEALKVVKELFSKPELLLQLAAPPLNATSDKDWISLDLDLIKIAIDALGECCHSSDNNICYASVSCVLALLKSLEEICGGAKMKEELVNHINSQFRTLESSDYKGAKSERWLKTKLRSLITSKQQKHESPKIRKKSSSSSEASEKLDDENNEQVSQEILSDAKKLELEPNGNETEDNTENNLNNAVHSNGENTSLDVANETENHKNPSEEINISEVSEEESEIPDSPVIRGQLELNLEVPKENEERGISDIVENITSVTESAEDAKVPEEESEIPNSPAIHGQLELNLEVPKENEERAISNVIEDITSPVTESAEDALNYVSSSSNDAITDDFDDSVATDEFQEDDVERLQKIPRTLLGDEDAGKEERERIEKLCLARFEFAQQERQNARSFVQNLQSFLPELLAIRSSVEADQALQEFSSKYCENMWQAQQVIKESSDTENVMSHITILNADGIYLALYSVLLLNLKLIRSNYYKDSASPIPLTEQQFIEEVHGSGVLVYLSATWIAELYQQVLAINMLEEAGYKPESLENYALVNLLSGLLFGTDDWWNKNIADVDGLGNTLPGAQQLADYRRLERAMVNSYNSPKVEAGKKFCRRILTCCWETLLEVLSVLLNGTNSCGISSTIGFLLGTEGAKEEHRKTKDAIAESLDGLQKAAKLCNILGLQTSCSAVFAQLAIASCPLSEDVIFPQAPSKSEPKQQFKRSLLPGRNRTLRLHESHILSMDVILSKGLELGSHSPDCWKYVFQCCLFVLQLENTYFSGHGNIQSILSRPIFQSINQNDDCDSSLYYETSSNDYGDLSSMPGSSLPQKLDVSEIIKKNRGFAQSSGVVKDHQLLEAVEALSQQVDRLFEEAANRLNLSALISFLVELCAASQNQLFSQNYIRFSSVAAQGSNLLLYHLGDVMLRCARGGRPLIHVMRAWSVVAPHFVEASCHKNTLISKKGVTTLHDIVNALLSSNSELPHFHFNEALFKPFENLLCLELCDVDVQEQIISSICEFVEGCTTEIRSGWRPLFGTLRSVRIPNSLPDLVNPGIDKEHVHHLRVVLDVFEAFLGTDNMFVFAYAAVDCLLCLLRHVKGPADVPDSTSEISVEKFSCHGIPLDMCLAALKYLEKCSAILSSMYAIPTCPVFNSANRIQLYSGPSLVDPVIPGLQLVYFNEPNSTEESSKSSDTLKYTNEINNIQTSSEIPVTLQKLDNHTGIIHVWFLLLEGLAGALATCPKRYQSHTMESLFTMLRSLKDIPGPEFGIYCVNHLLLPMLQNWLRRTTKIYRGWDNFTTNFKQCCGLATDLIVDYIQHIAETEPHNLCKEYGVHLMIEQLFLVLTECVSQPMEIISRLGCACIRHNVMSAGQYFTPALWDVVCHNLKRACAVSLNSIKQLMVCFNVDSENFYGDIGEVKVAARRDCTIQESERLRQLACQVFLLDCQQAFNPIMKSTYIEDDERSFTFLLVPPGENPDDPDTNIIRVPFSSLVVGLLSHQILLQTIGSLLLQGTKYMLPILVTLLPSENSSPLPCEVFSKPGFLSRLSMKQLQVLMSSLENSYETACDFDMRPGLKFLVQKVAQTNAAANLYKQAGVSWTIQVVVLFELCISVESINLDFVKQQIYSKAPNSNEKCSAKDSNDPGNEINFNEFELLKDKYKEICETYTEHTIEKEGFTSIVDKMSDQPVFFLAAPADEMVDFIQSGEHGDMQDAKFEDRDDSKHYYDSSDSDDIGIREENGKDRVYTLATEHTINSLMTKYKKRKTQHSMPSRIKEKLSRKLSSNSRKGTSSNTSLPEEIVVQRRNSIMKDGEAHLQVFKQLIQSFLDLSQSLEDEQFKAFLPVFFPGVQFLVAYTSDAELRLSISEWLQRLAVCCDIYPPARTD